jgi:transcriptional regulator with XRE-family HTH domain
MSTNAHPSRTWVINYAKDFGKTVAGVRRARGLTQGELAELTGIDRTYLAKLESGSGTVELQRLVLALRRMGAEVFVTFQERPDAEED